MTGVLNAMVGIVPGTRVVVTTASFGAPIGFRLSPLAGAISPASYKGENFSEAFSQSGTDITFRVAFADDALSQSFFSQVVVQKDDGAWITLRTSSAGFANQAGVQTVWQWDGVPAWTTASVSRAFYIL